MMSIRRDKPKTAAKSRFRRFISRAALVITLLLVLLAVEEVSFFAHTPKIYSQRGNAMWIRHHWVMDKHTEAEYKSLAKMLHDFEAKDAYFHAGPFEADGTVRPERVAHIRDLVKAMKRLCPDVRIQPWLGQVEYGGGGKLDLADNKTRANILKTSEQFLDMGFDGIHYDIEPIHSGNTHFLKLLEGTHKLTKARGKLLSVAAAHPEPIPGIERTVGLVANNPGYWTRDYFLKVAEKVDQIAVMTYDTGIPVPGIYGRVVAWTTEWAVDNGVNDLLIGVPTYGKGSPAHMTWVENVPNALRGLKHGVGTMKPGDRAKVGAAVFAEWTTSDEEKRTYQRVWMNR